MAHPFSFRKSHASSIVVFRRGEKHTLTTSFTGKQLIAFHAFTTSHHNTASAYWMICKTRMHQQLHRTLSTWPRAEASQILNCCYISFGVGYKRRHTSTYDTTINPEFTNTMICKTRMQQQLHRTLSTWPRAEASQILNCCYISFGVGYKRLHTSTYDTTINPELTNTFDMSDS
jgi:uncharacterized protein YifN (PemK superfamily)